MIYNIIDNNLRCFRLSAGLTQEGVAKSIGVTGQTFIAIEKGKYVPVLLGLMSAKPFYVLRMNSSMVPNIAELVVSLTFIVLLVLKLNPQNLLMTNKEQMIILTRLVARRVSTRESSSTIGRAPSARPCISIGQADSRIWREWRSWFLQ